MPFQVLVETNKMDLRATDRFFHRKDYVNRETFTNHEPAGRIQNWKPNWVDNLCNASASLSESSSLRSTRAS